MRKKLEVIEPFFDKKTNKAFDVGRFLERDKERAMELVRAKKCVLYDSKPEKERIKKE